MEFLVWLQTRGNLFLVRRKRAILKVRCLQVDDGHRVEARRPFAVRKPLRSQPANSEFRAVTVPATDGVTIFADLEYREDYGHVRFAWGSHLLLTELSIFRDATEDLLG
jgi:hypothetical protein